MATRCRKLQLFKLKNNKLSVIKERDLDLEAEMQSVVEGNLQNILSLEFVSSEFMLRGFRIDTLAFDKQVNAFVIIEYKKEKNFSVIDQGVSYMNLMVNNEAEFVLEYNEKTHQKLERKDVDWPQSRIIFISPEFNKYQQHAVGFRDLGIRLYQVKKYDEGIFSFDEIKPSESSKSIAIIAKSNPIARKVSEVIKTYTEEAVLEPASENNKSIYYELKKHVLELGNDIEVRPTKMYISYRRNKNFAGFVILKNVLKIYLSIKKSSLHDPLRKTRNVEGIGHFSPGNTELVVKNEKDIPYVLKLISQAYKNN